MTEEGVDYAVDWYPGLGAKLYAAGKRFAARYLSGGGSKDLTPAERDDLHGADLAIVLVWETNGQTGPLLGSNGGQLDAGAAIRQAQRLGAPKGTCLYFAVDFNASTSLIPTLRAYFVTATKLCHDAGYRCGVYGGLAVVTAVAGIVDRLWQTYAWSYGQWHPAAMLRQYLNGQRVAGITVDLDTMLGPDVGQWPLPAPPPAPRPPDPLTEIAG